MFFLVQAIQSPANPACWLFWIFPFVLMIFTCWQVGWHSYKTFRVGEQERFMLYQISRPELNNQDGFHIFLCNRTFWVMWELSSKPDSACNSSTWKALRQKDQERFHAMGQRDGRREGWGPRKLNGDLRSHDWSGLDRQDSLSPTVLPVTVQPPRTGNFLVVVCLPPDRKT